jgi:hypothetical protein
MSVKPGDPLTELFTTYDPSTGASANADSLPTATLTHNGSDDGAAPLSVSELDTGRYKISGTIPAGYASGDKVQVWVAAVVGGVSAKAVVADYVLDGKRVSDLHDLAAGAPMELDSSQNIYPADVEFVPNDTASADEYTVAWFRNGTPLATGVSAATIEVTSRDDGTDLVPSGTAMTAIGSSGAWKYDEPTNRLSPGATALVTVAATIDGATRTWRRLVMRADS